VATTEALVLSAVCKNKDVHVILGENAEIFGGYGDVFDFICDYYQKYKAVPDISIIEGEFGNVEFPDTTAASPFYLESLRSEYIDNRLEQVMLKSADAQKKGMSGPERLSKMLTSLSKLGQYTSSVQDLSLMDADNAAEYFEKIKTLTDLNGGTSGISTGFDTIDSAYPTGLAPGHNILLMGYTGKGKSMWSGLLGVNAWLQHYKVMVISLEMPPEEYRERIYAMMSKGMFKMTNMRRGEVDPDDFRTWAKKMFDGASDFIVISNEGSADVTPNIVQAKIDMYRPDIVILDYDQLMMDNAHTRDMTPRMMALSREIKLLATSNAIPIIHISAVTDEENDKRDSPPRLGMSAWSKAIEYDANLVIAVHLHDDTHVVEIAGRKNRNGPLFNCFFDVDFDSGIWTERFE
jgi:replicative DNA helicase